MTQLSPGDFSPAPIMELINAYQKSEAIKAAFELDLFTIMMNGQSSAGDIAKAIKCSEKGVRILCDYLTAEKILNKDGNSYFLPQNLAPFLVKGSPMFVGPAVDFIQHPELKRAFNDVAGCVKKGGCMFSDLGTMQPEHPVWIEFAKSMAAFLRAQALMLAPLIPFSTDKKLKILDVAAGHGMFGIELLRIYQQAEVTALDWLKVLEIAEKNAKEAEVLTRFRKLPGDVFEVNLTEKYDLILLANFLHHLNAQDCVKLLKRLGAVLNEDGRIITLEFVPNPDRISPKGSAQFSFVMLCSTPEGDAYTFEEYRSIFEQAGLKNNTLHSLAPGMEEVIISGR